jgi:hypothetical protein
VTVGSLQSTSFAQQYPRVWEREHFEASTVLIANDRSQPVGNLLDLRLTFCCFNALRLLECLWVTDGLKSSLVHTWPPGIV